MGAGLAATDPPFQAAAARQGRPSLADARRRLAASRAAVAGLTCSP
jgi:hypothetical protein